MNAHVWRARQKCDTKINVFQFLFQKEGSLQKAQSIISRVITPSKVEVSALASHFSAKSLAQSSAHGWKRRKSNARIRPTKVTVVLLEKYSASVPKGKIRQDLASRGRILSIRFHRGMSSQDVQEKIEESPSFTFLECDSGHHLIKAAEQELNGEDVVTRKGSLYQFSKVWWQECD